MKNKSLAMLSPLCLGLFAGSAWADLEPFSFGAAETVAHQSNLEHSADADRISDWTSTTAITAGLNQALGRDKLIASIEADLNRYKHSHFLNSTGYRGSAEFDWSTIGDLSGALGADADRRQYIYGETADVVPGHSPSVVSLRNLQTDSHAFGRVTLGGESRWTIFGGADANKRTFSADTFSVDNEQQWSTNIGTRYATSPDLSFGVTGAYVNGEYPDGLGSGVSAKFSTRSFDLTTRWQASGNSALDASVGYTSEDSDALSGNRNFVNGSLNWTWTPPSHFTVNLGLKRSSDVDSTSTLVNAGVVNNGTLNGTSVNNVAHLEVTYALTAKVNLDASADYTQRKYSDLKQLTGPDVNGSTRTSRLYLTAHYQPTRTTDLSCGGGREVRKVDATLAPLAPAYTDNYVQCVASIRFE